MAYADDATEDHHQRSRFGEPGNREPVQVLGVPFTPLEVEEAIARVRIMLRSSEPHQIVIANAHTLNLAHVKPSYRDILRNASLVLRDGIGVEIAARLLGKELRHNFVGTDFVPLLLRAVATPRIRIFLFGAPPGIALAAGDALKRSSPAIEIVGTENGYVDFEDVVERVRSARPDVLLVALGNPLQEQWIAANLSRLNARVAIGVGALFDFLAGRVPRAPKWIRTLRSEWLYRFYLEPGRLWRRYLIGNVQFLWRVARAGRSQRS